MLIVVIREKRRKGKYGGINYNAYRPQTSLPIPDFDISKDLILVVVTVLRQVSKHSKEYRNGVGVDVYIYHH